MGQLCEAPFQPFVQVITAETIFSAAFLGWVCASGLLVAVMFRLVFRVDAVARASQILAERAVYRSSGMGNRFAQGASQFLPASLPRILHLGGIGPFAWRQMVGALRYKFSLPVALIAPALLSLYPLLQPLEPMSAFLQVVGGLVFYSFLLLPAALKFDFRRDFDHLAAFKMLPASPVTIVCGQLATPVLLTTLLQMLVLAVVALIKPVPVAHLLAVSGVLLPINVLIFAMENLIFMLSPHRLNQEGIDIFLRTILVFTAKGVFFAAALFMLLAWSHLARSLSHVVSAHWGIDASNRLLFMAGIWLMTVVTACLCTKLLVRAFRHYDPSLDAAGS